MIWSDTDQYFNENITSSLLRQSSTPQILKFDDYTIMSIFKIIIFYKITYSN